MHYCVKILLVIKKLTTSFTPSTILNSKYIFGRTKSNGYYNKANSAVLQIKPSLLRSIKWKNEVKETFPISQ